MDTRRSYYFAHRQDDFADTNQTYRMIYAPSLLANLSCPKRPLNAAAVSAAPAAPQYWRRCGGLRLRLGPLEALSKNTLGSHKRHIPNHSPAVD